MISQGRYLAQFLLDPRVGATGHSPTLASRERANALCAAGRRVHRLELGQSPFPVPQPVVDALRAHAAEKDYLPVRGLPELRRAVADYHRRRHGVTRAEDDVLVGPGSKELMFLLLFSFNGEFLVPTPAWVSYAPQARLAGRKLKLLPTAASEGHRLTAAALERVCRFEGSAPRLLVLNYPSNPTGATYAAGELAELADVCRRHDVIVLSDEIYGELHFQGQHNSLVGYYEEGTILSGGLSKWCGAGGWRLGTFSFPPGLRWLADAIAAVGSETYSTTSAPIQYAAVRAFRAGAEIEDYLRDARRVLATLLGWSASVLRKCGVDVLDAAGGFYLFPDFERLRGRLDARGIRSDLDLAGCLLDDIGVSALPGRDFGMDPGSLHLRLALVDFDGAKALAAAPAHDSIDESFLRRYCAPTYEAVRAIAAWLEGM
jgi:aspartate aminotransferase